MTGEEMSGHRDSCPATFLVLAFVPSWLTIDWITMITKDSYQPHIVGTYNRVAVMECAPLTTEEF